MQGLKPYIIFPGNCEEAMNFYIKQLNGNLVFIQHFSEAPGEVPPGSGDKVLHATIEFDGNMIMGADNPSGEHVKPGNNIHLSVTSNNLERVQTCFNNLADNGGRISMPLQETFWGATFGMVTDKYGVHWMWSYEKEQQGT